MNTKSENQEKSLEQTFEDLIEKYKKENNSNDFLLFDLAHANENAHTKVLLWLLSYKENGKYIFLPSFLKLLNISYETCENYNASDQKTAIGNKGTGFIDLYIEGEENKIIIENKIYGAADTERQLARYVATAQGIGNKKDEEKQEDDFDQWYDDIRNGKYKEIDKNIYVIYLTADGTKYPDDRRKDKTKFSLPDKLGELLNDRFIPINYTDHILPWLELEYDNNKNWNKTIKSGLIQYIEYLKFFLSAGKKSNVVEQYVDTYKDFVSFMRNLKYLYNKYGKKTDNKGTVIPLFKEMMSASESKFFSNLGGDWHIHVLLNSIILYKNSWATLDKTRKYTIPTLHLVANNSKYLEGGEKGELKWFLEVDHLEIKDENERKKEVGKCKYSNHYKTFRFDLKNKIELQSSIPPKDENVIPFDNSNAVIQAIDNAIKEYIDPNFSKNITPNELLGELYDILINKCNEDTK